MAGKSSDPLLCPILTLWSSGPSSGSVAATRACRRVRYLGSFFVVSFLGPAFVVVSRAGARVTCGRLGPALELDASSSCLVVAWSWLLVVSVAVSWWLSCGGGTPGCAPWGVLHHLPSMALVVTFVHVEVVGLLFPVPVSPPLATWGLAGVDGALNGEMAGAGAVPCVVALSENRRHGVSRGSPKGGSGPSPFTSMLSANPRNTAGFLLAWFHGSTMFWMHVSCGPGVSV